MTTLKTGDSFPEAVTFTYVKPTGKADITACGLPTQYNASEEFKNKKIVLVSVPGAFTPTCQEQHIQSYLENLQKLKAKGVDQIIVIAYNDCWVMAAWAKANGVLDDSILFMTDSGTEFSKKLGWTLGERTARYAIIVDQGKITYAGLDDTKGSIENSGAEGVLAKL